MDIHKRAIIGVIAVVGFVLFTNYDNFSTYSLTNDEVKLIIDDTIKNFAEAEKEILGVDPLPTPEPNVPVGPDPDAEKCICKGTGKIVQGDGHVSPCPYHSGQEPESVSPKPVKKQNNVKSRRGIFGGRLFGTK